MKKPILRGYYGGIFFEFVLQDRNADAMIIFPGFPSGNDFSDLIAFFYEKGYHVFVPRYRGTYQSSGVFLSKSPVEDMIFFLEGLDSGSARSMWDMKKEAFKINKKILLASSFGGAIALGVAAKYDKISHLILQAPVWDFKLHNADGSEQDLDKTTEFVRSAYKNCYRFRFKNLTKKLGKFDDMDPDFYLPKVKTTPILVMHDPNDKEVALKHTKEKMTTLEKGTYLEHYLGHKLTRDILTAYWKDIDKFIKINYVD